MTTIALPPGQPKALTPAEKAEARIAYELSSAKQKYTDPLPLPRRRK